MLIRITMAIGKTWGRLKILTDFFVYLHSINFEQIIIIYSKMRKLKYVLYGCFLLLCLAFVSCGEKEKEFDSSLLPGKWNQGAYYEVYKSNGTGYTWDEADDVTEDEAKKMKWTLDKDELTQIHIMEIGGAEIPKVYTVTELTSTTFKYKNNYGDSYSFTRIE